MSKRHQHPGIDLENFSFPGLIFLLRHRELWPKGFEWNFLNCHTCAMGLIHRQWLSPVDVFDLDDFIMIEGERPGLRRPFLHGSYNKTPEQVADELEELIK
jgi:hypothetical protein